MWSKIWIMRGFVFVATDVTQWTTLWHNVIDLLEGILGKKVERIGLRRREIKEDHGVFHWD